MTMKEVREAASVAKVEEDAATEEAISGMTVDRKAATTAPIHKRSKQPVKKKWGTR
jgi:hypothetical protein